LQSAGYAAGSGILFGISVIARFRSSVISIARMPMATRYCGNEELPSFNDAMDYYQCLMPVKSRIATRGLLLFSIAKMAQEKEKSEARNIAPAQLQHISGLPDKKGSRMKNHAAPFLF